MKQPKQSGKESKEAIVGETNVTDREEESLIGKKTNKEKEKRNAEVRLVSRGQLKKKNLYRKDVS